MICPSFADPKYLIWAENVPPLLYYSHLPSLAVSLFLGIFVYFKSNRSLLGKILLFISVSFFLWVFLNLITWTNNNSNIITFTWSFFGILYGLLYVLSIYFVHVFVEKKDVTLAKKGILFSLMLPLILVTPTYLNLKGFNLDLCGSAGFEGQAFIFYETALGIIAFLWILIFLIFKYRKAESDLKRQIIFLGIGIEAFLFSFFLTGFLASYLTDKGIISDFGLEFYGLFGMTFFMAMLAYLIVKFKAFNIKMLAAEALVAALVILLFSEFFFIGIENTTATVLISVTILLSTIFGIWLINSVRNEVKRKEELQVMSDNLAVANDKLKKLDNAKSEFISIASHQLRTPLTAIKGYVSLIIEGTFGKVDPKIKDALGKTYVANERLIKLVEDLLNVSRIESGRLEFDMQPQQVENIVKGLADDFIFATKKSGLYLHINLPETPLPPVKIDKAKITEVISNMIDNSIKYTKRGGVTVRAELVKSQYPNPNIQQNPKIQNTKYDIQATGAVRITVSDTGIGIPAENLPYLFAKFSRGKDTSKLHASGTGLGMFVAKNIAEAHGGRIWAESDGENKGSRFIVELPVESGKL